MDYIVKSAHKTGKTAPRLIADLLVYNPSEGYNTLCKPPPYEDLDAFAHSLPNRHSHTLTLKREQSTLPDAWVPDTSRAWVVASICETCRLHVEVKVDSSEPSLSQSSPCPTKDNPLHHLHYEPSILYAVDAAYVKAHRKERWKDVRDFTCTALGCPAYVTITTRAPILSERLVTLLTDPDVIQKRVDRYGEHGKGGTLPAHNALKTLGTYLRLALNGDKRSIPRENPRYLLSLSDDSREVMETVHFRDINENGSPLWAPPEGLDTDPEIRRDLQDMFEETQILMDQHRMPEQASVRIGAVRAEGHIKRILRSQYKPVVETWTIDLTKPEHPSYAVLGVVADVPDPIILWAYNRQRERNPRGTPLYFQHLTLLANGRGSETLQLEVGKLRSQEVYYTLDDVKAAYKLFSLKEFEKDEQLIIGSFNSRLKDAPRQETEMRKNLQIIGQFRDSEIIKQAAQKAFRDVKDAYSWLCVPEVTEDQMLLSQYQVRVNDNPSDEPTAKKALKAIAEARQSHHLLTFLETGMPLDVNAAYATLGIEDQTVADDNLLINIFNISLSDAPGRIVDLRAALRAIAESRSSTKLREFLETGQNDGQKRGSAASPVGLDNIGNTCYLNSLLQFYFTIKPLREMVLNFDQYREEEATDEVVERKRVGGRKVTKREIERAKKFVEHLRTLFQNLIKTSASAISPERDLAYLALVSSKDEDGSVGDGEGAAIGNVDEDKMDIDQPPPLPPPPPPPLPPPPPPESRDEDTSSETTLVNDDGGEEGGGVCQAEDQVMVDADKKDSQLDGKENVPPAQPAPIGSPRAPLVDVSMGSAAINSGAPPTPPPDRAPPPIPLRPAAVQNTATDINMFGRQQDVTECIGNVMFQIEAAIKPDGYDENQEQIDLVKRYFYGKTKQTLTFPNSSEVRTKEELFSHLLVNVAESDRDLYSALDNSFDIEKVDLEGRDAQRFLSISQLPPVLQIQVQRVQFDREKGSAYKSNAYLNFPETLFMDRYVDTDDARLIVRREESWKWKEELKKLADRKAEFVKTPVGTDLATALDVAREWVEDMQTMSAILEDGEGGMAIDPSLVTTLEKRAAAVRREVDVIDKDIKALESRINQQFTDLRKHCYRIHSVFIHRGSVTFGHYWIYIYDFDKGIFRKYNDQYISEVVDVSEVFRHSDTDAQPPTPYFLVFVRDDQQNITEAVKRKIED